VDPGPEAGVAIEDETDAVSFGGADGFTGITWAGGVDPGPEAGVGIEDEADAVSFGGADGFIGP